ncbi:hypothetical protein QE94_004543 [Salmonella enterica subsp. enterica]|nr:hypothetical protein [Salmonella enterica subsp. enterica]
MVARSARRFAAFDLMGSGWASSPDRIPLAACSKGVQPARNEAVFSPHALAAYYEARRCGEIMRRES